MFLRIKFRIFQILELTQIFLNFSENLKFQRFLFFFSERNLSRYDENVTKLIDIYIYRSRRLHESIELTFHSPLGGILENESGNSPD